MSDHVTAAIITNLNEDNQRLTARIAELEAAACEDVIALSTLREQLVAAKEVMLFYADHANWYSDGITDYSRVLNHAFHHGYEPAEAVLKNTEPNDA